jgi:hypothetical protein
MIEYKRITEDITIPLNKNDKFLYGKFKNKTAIYDHDYINDKGDIIIVTDTGKEISACKIRLIKESNTNRYINILEKIKN